MPRHQQEITGNTKKQEDVSQSREQNIKGETELAASNHRISNK